MYAGHEGGAYAKNSFGNMYAHNWLPLCSSLFGTVTSFSSLYIYFLLCLYVSWNLVHLSLDLCIDVMFMISTFSPLPRTIK